MDKFRRLMARYLLGQDFTEKYDLAMEALMEASHYRPMMVVSHLQGGQVDDIEQGLEALAETDSRYLALLRRLRRYRSASLSLDLSETERLLAVEEARELLDTDPAGERAITIWTDFGFGTRTEIVVDVPAVNVVFKEFWIAYRNRSMWSERILHEHSQTFLTDGEIWWPISTSTIDGKSTARVVETGDITEVVFDPRDDQVPVYYKRALSGTLESVYYRDWLAPLDAVQRARESIEDGQYAEEQDEATDVVMFHAAFNRRKVTDVRGWPLTKTAAPWLREYHSFLQDRRAVSRAVAAFVDKLVIKGRQAPIDAMRTRLDARMRNLDTLLTSKEPIAATWLENENATRERMDLGTGGSDARTDGMTILAQAATGVGIPPNLLGRPDMMQNRSVADVSMKPSMIMWKRYRLTWESIWKDLVACVWLQYQLAPMKTDPDLEYEVTVSSDALLEYTADEVLAALAALKTAYEMGISVDDLAPSVTYLLRLTLQFLGAPDVEKLVPDAMRAKAPVLPAIPEPLPDTALRLMAANYASGAISLAVLAENIEAHDGYN